MFMLYLFPLFVTCGVNCVMLAVNKRIFYSGLLYDGRRRCEHKQTDDVVDAAVTTRPSINSVRQVRACLSLSFLCHFNVTVDN